VKVTRRSLAEDDDGPMGKSGGRNPDWHAELHRDRLDVPTAVLDEAERAFATLFDCTDHGVTGSSAGNGVRVAIPARTVIMITISTAANQRGN